MIRVAPMPQSDAGWFDRVAELYFQELIADCDPFEPGEFEFLWQDPAWTVLKVFAGHDRAGFAMIKDFGGFRELAEFCILPERRKNGIGTQAATLCFMLFPGRWRLGVAHALPRTARFWDRLLPTIAGLKQLHRGPPLFDSQ
mmetsp:Transcript_27659/g.51383  ORF Transcript_27659/g.51383 Transcript_27659/m.51383 type:complete len:142 (-) Transcript_27659:24-449(-)